MIEFLAQKMRLVKIILTIGVVMLLSSYSLEYGLHLSPCIICEVQRLLLYPIICFSILNILVCKYRVALVTCIVNFLAAGFAVYLGWHHLQIINSPHNVDNSCMPHLFDLINMHGISTAIEHLFAVSLTCSNISWKFLGFNIAQVSLTLYIILFLLLFIEFILLIKTNLTQSKQVT